MKSSIAVLFFMGYACALVVPVPKHTGVPHGDGSYGILMPDGSQTFFYTNAPALEFYFNKRQIYYKLSLPCF